MSGMSRLPHGSARPAPVSNGGAGDFVSVLHNRDPAGSMQLPFHCDLTYTDVPIKAICLQAIELPGQPHLDHFRQQLRRVGPAVARAASTP